MADVALQVDRIAPDATHFVVSVGGNDALGQLGVLQDRTNSIAAALNRLATIREGFEADYRSMLERVLARGLRSRSFYPTTTQERAAPKSSPGAGSEPPETGIERCSLASGMVGPARFPRAQAGCSIGLVELTGVPPTGYSVRGQECGAAE